LQDLVFLFDVDNTLLDNDGVIAGLRARLAETFGAASAERYWSHFETLRLELGYVDYIGALQQYRAEVANDPRLFAVSSYLLDQDFAQRVYPGSMKALAHARQWGPTVIVSDGDVVLQPRKVQRSGLWDAVEGRVLIYVHKEEELADIERRHPARHYVMIDDKLRLLTAMKAIWRERLTTVFVRQGHYAHDAATVAALPPADLAIDTIGELTLCDRAALHGAASARRLESLP
jgi:FMN phosphatase YigB (HAD superfamily)